MFKKRLNLSNGKKGSTASFLSVTLFLPYLSSLLSTFYLKKYNIELVLSKELKYGEGTVLFLESQVVLALSYSQIIPN